MPNECSNYITIKFNLQNDADDFVNDFFKNYEGGRDKRLSRKGTYGVIVGVITPWGPDVEWLLKILEKYHKCWIKTEWNEGGGIAGVWVGYYKDGEKVIHEMEWPDLTTEDLCFLFGDRQIE